MANLTDNLLIVVKASGSAAVSEMHDLKKSASDTDSAFGSMGKTLKTGLAAGAAALIGTGLVSFLNDSMTAYADAAKAAGDLATATGSSITTVSRLTAAMKDAGVSADATAGMLTKFTTNAGKNKDLLDDLGVSLKQNADGSADYADGMVQAVDATLKIGDASERSQTLVTLLGKQGAKSLQDLTASGMSLADAMEQIDASRVFTEADRRRAAQYDDAMDAMSASMEGLQNTIGRNLVPVVAEGAAALAGMIDLLAQVPVEVYLVVGAAVALNAAMKSEMVMGALSSVGTFVAQSATGFAVLRTEMGLTSAAAAAASKAISAAFLSNPVTAALVAVTAAVAALVWAQDDLESATQASAAQLGELTRGGKDAAAAVGTLAEEMEGSRSALQNWFAAFQSQGGWKWIGPPGMVVASLRSMSAALRDGGDDSAEYARQIGRIAEEEGAMAAASADAQAQQRALADLIAQGVVDGQEFAAAVADAGDAQAEQKRIARDTEAAMLGYADASKAAKFWQDELNAVIESGVVSGGRFDDVSREAAEAMHRQSEGARAAEEALDRFNFTYSQLVEDLQDTEAWGGGVEKLKASLDGLDFSQKADEWGDEWKAAAEDARSSILGELGRAVEETPTIDPVKWLEDLKEGAPPEVRKVIEGLQQEVRDNPLAIPTDVQTPTPADIQARIAEINRVLSSTWNEQVTGPLVKEKKGLEEQLAVKVPVAVNLTGAAETQTQITELTAPKSTTITMETQFAPGGYSAVRDRADYLAREREGRISITTAMVPDGYSANKDRADYLAQSRTGEVTVNTRYTPDGYQANKDRIDYLSDDRTAYIDVVVRGQQAARKAIDGLLPQTAPGPAQTAAAPAPVTNHWTITVNGARDPESTVRAVERWARDNGRPEKVVVTV